MNKNWTALKTATALSGWAGIVESKCMLPGWICCTPTSSTNLQESLQLLRAFATFSDFHRMSCWKWKVQKDPNLPKTPGAVAKLNGHWENCTGKAWADFTEPTGLMNKSLSNLALNTWGMGHLQPLWAACSVPHNPFSLCPSPMLHEFNALQNTLVGFGFYFTEAIDSESVPQSCWEYRAISLSPPSPHLVCPFFFLSLLGMGDLSYLRYRFLEPWKAEENFKSVTRSSKFKSLSLVKEASLSN